MQTDSDNMATEGKKKGEKTPLYPKDNKIYPNTDCDDGRSGSGRAGPGTDDERLKHSSPVSKRGLGNTPNELEEFKEEYNEIKGETIVANLDSIDAASAHTGVGGRH